MMPEEVPEEVLTALREGDEAQRATAYAAIAPSRDADARAHRAALRAAVAALLAGSLRPTDRAIVRRLLQAEIADTRAAGHGAPEALFVLATALARFAQPEDALLFWRAREATPETRAGIDVELMARAGEERVRRSLRERIAAQDPDAGEARQALAWLDEGRATGALDDLPGYFAWAEDRFGIHVSGPV